MTDALERVAALVRREWGIAIDAGQFPSLDAAIGRVEPGLDADALLKRVGTRPDAELLARLIDEVTVNETFFFRARHELDAVDWPLLLEGARAQGDTTARVWSAACATGEEAYTLAILASEALGTREPPVTILATDISDTALARAAAAGYGRNSVRHVPPEIRDRYFTPHDQSLVVGESPRSLVTFKRHNLAWDPAPPVGEQRFDLIVCRNVLMYFEPAAVNRTISSCERALRGEGMLVLGAVDQLCSSARAGVPAAPAPASAPAPAPAAAGAAPEWNLEETGRAAEQVLVDDPLNADAYYVRGVSDLAAGDPGAAAESLRRALYLHPTFALAAFKLGRAYDVLGNPRAARRAYAQALRTLSSDDEIQQRFLAEVDLGDVAAASSARLMELGG